MNPYGWMLRDRRNHMQSYGLYRWSAIAAMTPVATDVWARSIGVEIDSNQAVKGIDQRNRISAPLFSGPSHVSDVGHIGRELHDHWNRRDFLHPGRDHGRVLRHLPDRSAHSPLRHAVRASEVKLQQIGPGILRAAHNVVPCLTLG